jgi:hypothetical protein
LELELHIFPLVMVLGASLMSCGLKGFDVQTLFYLFFYEKVSPSHSSVDIKAHDIFDAVNTQAKTCHNLDRLTKQARSAFSFLPSTFRAHCVAGFPGLVFLPRLGVCWILGFHTHSGLSAFCALACRASLSLSRFLMVFGPMAREGSAVQEVMEDVEAENPTEVSHQEECVDSSSTDQS